MTEINWKHSIENLQIKINVIDKCLEFLIKIENKILNIMNNKGAITVDKEIKNFVKPIWIHLKSYIGWVSEKIIIIKIHLKIKLINIIETKIKIPKN